MPSPQASYALSDLIGRMHEQIDPAKTAGEEAIRLIVRLGLRHPMTFSAALKVVATEFQHGRVAEIDRIARALHAKLLPRPH